MRQREILNVVGLIFFKDFDVFLPLVGIVAAVTVAITIVDMIFIIYIVVVVVVSDSFRSARFGLEPCLSKQSLGRNLWSIRPQSVPSFGRL